jgi:hypothetical protein
MVESRRKLGRESKELRGYLVGIFLCLAYALEFDFWGQLNARLVFMAFFWGPKFSKTRKHHQIPYKNTHLSEVQPLFLAVSVSLLSEELRMKPLYLAISLSLTIRIKFNFTVHVHVASLFI